MAKVIVIGGGPSGMIAALYASQKHKVMLIEKNEKLGKKLYITGKGRCNITNGKDISEFFDYIPGNPEFLYSALYSFTNSDVIKLFENLGVKLKTERGDRIFPESDKSYDIIRSLEKALIKNNVEIKLNTEVKNIESQDNKIRSIRTSMSEIIEGDYFIVCTGGLSYPQTGCTGDGYKFAKSVGHSIKTPFPSLVPIEVKENWIKELQGLSLKNVALKLLQNNKIVYEDFGELLFTHFGVSGPLCLSCSRFVFGRSNSIISIDLKPGLTNDDLDKRLQKDFVKYTNKDFKNSLNELLPQKLIPLVIKLSEIDENKKVNVITKDERKRLLDLIKNFKLSVKGLRPIEEAIITAGGINVRELDPSTMKSKLISNLYFAGEVIDVDGYTGGFNLQIAMSTGYLAGNSIGDGECL